MNEPTYHLTNVVKSKNSDPENFSGPLDVILLLISKNKIEIRDIQIAVILDQYLAYLDEMKRMDLEIASEFITMASQLVLIKTKMLLSEAERQEGLSEMELLIQSLEKRQRQEIFEKLKNSALWLEDRNEIGRTTYIRQQEPLKKEQEYRYKHSSADLVTALNDIEERGQKKLPSRITAFDGIVGKEPYPVETKASEVLKRIYTRGVQRIRALFAGNRSRSEVVATFLSILDLVRRKKAIVETDDHDELTLRYCETSQTEEV